MYAYVAHDNGGVGELERVQLGDGTPCQYYVTREWEHKTPVNDVIQVESVLYLIKYLLINQSINQITGDSGAYGSIVNVVDTAFPPLPVILLYFILTVVHSIE